MLNFDTGEVARVGRYVGKRVGVTCIVPEFHLWARPLQLPWPRLQSRRLAHQPDDAIRGW